MADLFKFGMQPMGPEEAPQDPFGNLDPVVAQYMRNKYSVADAKKNADTADKIAGGVGVADAIMNAMSKPVVYQNRMQDLGKAPAMLEATKYNNNVSGLQKQAQMKLAQATSDEDNAVKMAFEQRKAELAQEAAAKKAAEDAIWRQKDYDQKERGIQAQAESRLAYANMMNGAKQDAAAAKQAAADAELNVPGYDRTGEVRQSPVEAKDARTAIGVANNMFKGLDLLDQQVKDNGSFEWGGTDGAGMAATANDLRLQAKELYNLGVLNGPDLQLMLKQIPDTESLGSMFTRDSTARAQLKSTKEAMKRKIEESMKAKGYSAKSAAPAAKPQTVTQNGHTYTLNPQTGEYE